MARRWRTVARRAVPAISRLACLLILACQGGCLTPEHRHFVPGPALAKGVQCQTQRVTGELVATRVCTLESQREAQEQGAQDARDFLTRQPIGACPGTPGCKN
jgi:hypothetical protein